MCKRDGKKMYSRQVTQLSTARTERVDNESIAYQNNRADKQKVCKEVSWPRDSRGRYLKLTAVCVHCHGVSRLLLYLAVSSYGSMYQILFLSPLL